MNISNLSVNNHNIILIIFVCFLAGLVLTPLVKRIAIHIGAVDKPDNKRKVHHKTMPRLGGLAIFLSFLLGYMIFAPKSTQMLSVLIGGFIIMLVGIFDDIRTINPGLRPIYKFIGQIIAASIVAFYGNITFADMTIFGIKFQFGVLAYPIAVLFIVSIMNAINFADGLDGLAAGTSTIYFITIAIISYIMNKLGGLDVIL